MTTVPTIPDGYYAVRYADKVGFYRAVTRTEGRWAGRQFINRYHSDSLGRITRVESESVRAAIENDVEAARQAFSREIGHCWNCGRALTDETSRSLGIGPDCRARLGYDGPGDAVDVDVPEAPRVEVEKVETPKGSGGTLTMVPPKIGMGFSAVLQTGYDPKLVERCRAIPGRRWDAANKWNTFTIVDGVTGPMLEALVKDFDLTLVGEIEYVPIADGAREQRPEKPHEPKPTRVVVETVEEVDTDTYSPIGKVHGSLCGPCRDGNHGDGCSGHLGIYRNAPCECDCPGGESARQSTRDHVAKEGARA